MKPRIFRVFCILASFVLLIGITSNAEESIYLDFSNYPDGPAESSDITSWSSSGTDQNPYYGNSLRLLYEGSTLTAKFHIKSKPDNAELVVNHLSSKSNMCRGNGYSPITISINGQLVVSNYDVAENHGGSHGYETDQWNVEKWLKKGQNTIKWQAGNLCTHYWIKWFKIKTSEQKKEEGFQLLVDERVKNTTIKIYGSREPSANSTVNYRLELSHKNLLADRAVLVVGFPDENVSAGYERATLELTRLPEGGWFKYEEKEDSVLADAAENLFLEMLPLGSIVGFAVDTQPDKDLEDYPNELLNQNKYDIIAGAYDYYHWYREVIKNPKKVRFTVPLHFDGRPKGKIFFFVKTANGGWLGGTEITFSKAINVS